MAADVAVSNEVADILRRSTVEDSVLRLPEGQLDRKLYVSVDKVLKALGGKWNRSKGGHVFADDPTPLLAEALGEGRAVKQATREGFFPTPASLVALLLELTGVEAGQTALEPSAGRGAIAGPLRDIVGADAITVVEKRDDNCEALRAQGFSPLEGDFLAADLPQFDVVAMNPPFEKAQDAVHVVRAYELLKPGGTLAAIVSESSLHRRDRKTMAFRDLLEHAGAQTILNAADAFRASGTLVRTATVCLHKKGA